MRITILANRDLAANLALNLLSTGLAEHNLTIFLSDSVGDPAVHPQALRDLAQFEQSLIDGHWKSINHSSAGISSFDELAQKTGKSIRTLNSINSGENFDIFKETQPDLVISIRYGVILKSRVICIPRYGVINLHSGLLPDYKGVMATFRAMQNGEKSIGATLHYIHDNSIDTGAVIGTTSLRVEASRSYLWHVLELYTGGCKLVVGAVNCIEKNGSADASEQSGGGRYYSFPTDDELKAFTRAGLKLFDEQELI